MDEQLIEWDHRLRTAVHRDIDGLPLEQSPASVAASVIAKARNRRRSPGAVGSIVATGVLIALAAIVALARPELKSSQGEQRLEGHWQLSEAIIDGSRLELAPNSPITFVAKPSFASGRSACNLYNARVSVSDTSIQIDAPGTTKRLCPGPVLALEDAYLAALPRVQTFTVGGGHLLLSGHGIELRYTSMCVSENASEHPDQAIEPLGRTSADCQTTET